MPPSKKKSTGLIKVAPVTGDELTAKNFIAALNQFISPEELKKHQHYFKFSDDKPLKGDKFIGVRMGQVFELAKAFIAMPIAEIEKLLESPVHEVRAGAMSIMGKKASSSKIREDQLKALFELYLRRHDRINSWDLVDLAAHHVVGRYLADKPRTVLYKLARSKNTYERRSAMLSTAHFIMKQKQTEDCFKIAELLINDNEEFVQSAVGWMLRTAGTVNRKRLIDFLHAHAATMPRNVLRASLEHFNKKEKELFMNKKKPAI